MVGAVDTLRAMWLALVVGARDVRRWPRRSTLLSEWQLQTRLRAPTPQCRFPQAAAGKTITLRFRLRPEGGRKSNPLVTESGATNNQNPAPVGTESGPFLGPRFRSHQVWILLARGKDFFVPRLKKNIKIYNFWTKKLVQILVPKLGPKSGLFNCFQNKSPEFGTETWTRFWTNSWGQIQTQKIQILIEKFCQAQRENLHQGSDPRSKIVQALNEKDGAEFGPVGLARLRARLQFSLRDPPTA